MATTRRAWRNLLSFLLLAAPLAAATTPPTPSGFPGAKTHVYRDLPTEPMRLHVFAPGDARVDDPRPALLFFFGGGWTTGTPEKSVFWAKLAASWGMIGVAADYRTKERFDTPPHAAVADARAALRWLQDHAAELGIDPKRVVVGGNSAGGHLALWTAIKATPPGSAASEAPLFPPAALVLFSTVSDTSQLSGYTPKRFGNDAEALSPLHQLDRSMPPVLALHGDADATVPHAQAQALHEKLRANGGSSELITVPGGSHGFGSQLPEWGRKSRTLVRDFLDRLKLLP